MTWNWNHGLEVFDFPDLSRVVGGASCKVLDVWGEQDAGYVIFMCGEVSYRDKGCLLAVLEEVPDVDITLVMLEASKKNWMICLLSWCLRRVWIHHLPQLRLQQEHPLQE